MPPRAFIAKLAILSALMVAPLLGVLAFEWPISTDFLFYATLTKLFTAQFWSGDLYPRWLIAANGGLGSPAMLFHGPLPYYISCVWQWLAPLDPHAFARLALNMGLALFTAGITSYRWLSRLFDQRTAQFGALLYAGFPYLFIIIYYAFAEHQLWIIACFPLMLEGAQDIIDSGWRGIPKLAIAYALACLMHVLSLTIFMGVPWLYALLMSAPGKRLKNMLAASLAGLLAIGLTAFYLLPLALNHDLVTTSHYISGKYFYAAHFFDVQAIAALFIVVAPLLGFFLEIPRDTRKLCLPPAARFWLVVIAMLLFFALPVSRFVWDHFTPLQFLQFPFRLYIGMLPGIIFIAMLWRPYVKSKNLYLYFWPVGFCFIAALGLHYFFLPTPEYTEKMTSYDLIPFSQDHVRWQDHGDLTKELFLPDEYLHMPDAVVMDGKAGIKLVSKSASSLRFHVDVTSATSTIKIKQFYAVAWTVDQPGITLSERDGLLTMTVPKGSTDITLRMTEFPGVRTGDMLSLFSLMLLAAMIARQRQKAASV